MKRFLIGIVVALASGALALPANAHEALLVKPLAEKKVAEIPDGPLFWRIENFPTLEAARAAAGNWSLATETGGKAWLFTLGTSGGATPGGTRVTELGPIQRVSAPQYLLRINEAKGPPGAITPPHTHPGSEAFYVLEGETSSNTPHGVKRVKAGQTEIGTGADTPMQVSSSGTTNLHSLVMFVVDATRPFSSPAKFP